MTFLENRPRYRCMLPRLCPPHHRPVPTPLIPPPHNPHRPVTCAKRDLHSGVFGGSVHEAMTDLVHLMSRLVTADGKILVPGIYHDVKAITDDERNAYTDLAFDCQEYAKVRHHDIVICAIELPSL